MCNSVFEMLPIIAVKMHQSVEMKDTQAARGAAAQVSHLVTVEEL